MSPAKALRGAIAAMTLWGMGVAAPVPPTHTLRAAELRPSGERVELWLPLPGYAGKPRLEVLGQPHRLVVDLPGVVKAPGLRRYPVAATHGLVSRVRVAQFASHPTPVTRLVLEVAAGTRVTVNRQSEGLTLSLAPGVGRVQATWAEGPSSVEAGAPAPVPAVAAPGVRTSLPTPSLGPLPVVAALVAQPSPSQASPKEDLERPVDPKPAGRTLNAAPLKYTGSPLTIDVQNTDIRDFLRILADTGKLNLVMDADVQGTAGFKFVDTPWDQVLDVILKNAGLGKEVQNGVLRVAKVERLQKEEEERKRLEEAQSLSGDLQTVTRPLSYAKVHDVQRILRDLLSKRGTAILDDRTNTLIITDLPKRIQVVEALIQTLDVPIPQVQIEARVVEANKDWQRQFGIKWPSSNSGNTTLTSGSSTSTSSTSTPWISSAGQPYWNGAITQKGANSSWVAWSPGVDGSTSLASPAGEVWLSFLSERLSINAILQAMEREGTVKIVSSPRIVTQNNKKATILNGEKVPYPTQQGGAQGGAITVSFMEANLQLDVTPQITNDGTIIMDIKLEKAEADFSRAVNGTPTILRKALDTQVRVRDGGTAVLGGVYITSSTNGVTGVPFLSKLPLIGFLFRKTEKAEANAELLVFITPRIIPQ